MKRINQISLRDQVIDAIRDAILHGEFKPGEKIHEHALAQQLGVSRTPIREAIGILEQQGLIHIVPKRGTFVARVGREEMRDKLSIRVVIEQLALKQAMERLTSKQWVEFCKKLEQILLEMKEAVEMGELTLTMR